MSEGVSAAERAGRSKRMSERTSDCPSTYFLHVAHLAGHLANVLASHVQRNVHLLVLNVGVRHELMRGLLLLLFVLWVGRAGG